MRYYEAYNLYVNKILGLSPKSRLIAALKKNICNRPNLNVQVLSVVLKQNHSLVSLTAGPTTTIWPETENFIIQGEAN